MPRRQLGMSPRAQGTAGLRAVSELGSAERRFGYLANTYTAFVTCQELYKY